MKTYNRLADLILLPIVLNLFDGNTNVTSDSGLSDEMKTYYSDYLVDNAEPNLIHDQFAQKHPIPKNGGKKIEFRKFSPLAKQLTPLTEGVTPNGQKLTMSVVDVEVRQYGGFIELSDILMLTAIDNNLVMATRLLGSQAGRTLDTITREVLAGGTNVQYGENAVLTRSALVGGEASGNHYFSVKCVRMAVRNLKNQNAQRIDGSWVGIIHPDAAYDLMDDAAWKNPHQYVDTTNLYEGEIGKIEGCRFVESTEAKIFHAENLTDAARNLTVASYSNKVITVDEAITAAEATALAGRKIIMHDASHDEIGTIASAAAGAAGAATITLKDAPTNIPADGDNIYPGEAGAAGRDVYGTMILGSDAYGTTELTGGGLQHIVKQLGSAGTADPLNQRATVGWKATKAAIRLVETFMVRVETASTFAAGAN